MKQDEVGDVTTAGLIGEEALGVEFLNERRSAEAGQTYPEKSSIADLID